MKKEVLIAIIIGLTLGLSLTYGFYQMRQSAKNNATPSVDLSEFVGVSPTPEPTVANKITILTPQEGTLLDEARTVLSGTTIPNSYLVLFVNEDEYITTSDQTGNFSFDVELENGSNLLAVHLVEDSGETSIAERVVIVGNDLDLPIPAASAAAKPEPTPSKVATSSARTARTTPAATKTPVPTKSP